MKDNGRKYDIARLAIWLSFAVGSLSIVALSWREAAPGAHIVTVFSDFTNVLMVCVSAFSVTNAAISSVAAWKSGTQTKIESSTQTKITGAPVAPPTEEGQ